MRKIVIVKQHDITDCGPACLSSIIKFYDGYVPIEMIRLKCMTTADGTSAYNLVEAAKFYNFNVSAIRVNNCLSLKNYDLPCIIHLKLKNNLHHFACLYEITKDNVVLMDPAQGKVKMKINEFSSIFTNVVILLKPHSTLVKYEKPNSISKIIISFFIDNKIISTKLLIYSISLVLLSLITNYFLKCGSFFSGGDFGLTILFLLMFIYFYIYMVKNYLDYIKNKLLAYMNKNISADLYNKFSHQLFILPLNFIKSKTSGEIISRYQELSQINQMIPDIIISVSLDLIMALITLIFSSIISIKLTIISIFVMIIYFIINLAFKNPTLQKINRNINLSSSFNTDIIDNVNTIISTKYINNEENMERRLEKSATNYLLDNMNMDLYLNKCNFIKNTIFDIGRWFILSYGLYLCCIQELNIINLFTFEMVINYFFDPIKDLSSMIPKYCFMKSSLYKLNEFAIIKEENNGRFRFKPGEIKVCNLSFYYENDNYILKNLNLNIKEKEKILFQGKSGSGKSTFCQILSKQLDYKNGEIKIGDININDIDLKDFRRNVTYIGQKDSLLVDTILKNILFERKVVDEKFLNVCKICEIDEIVNKKINNYETIINESAMNISGGERQRIILARGLINPGKIIILDEALSEVNKDMEERIIKRIFKYFKDKTIIYVSHKEYNNIFNRKVVFNF